MARARKTTAKRKRKKSTRKSRQGNRWQLPWLRIALVLLVLLGAYWVYLDATIRSQFEGKKWALPAKVYARPLEIFTGMDLTADALAQELTLLGYRKRLALQQPGDYSRDRHRFHLYTRAFTFWDGREQSLRIRVEFANQRISQLVALDGTELDLVRLDPLQIASISPAHNEDRELVQLTDVPELLPAALMAVEDRNFYEHHGISLRGIARAMLANLKAGGFVQGGSTLTQQLVKNFYLSREKSLLRKLNEAQMSLLLELHYSKDEILEAYLNEVFLGQDGARAIHGFGLASQFYFERPLAQLAPEQIALLVGMVKGPTYYDPRRHPERALQRRNLVLEVLADSGILTARESERYQTRPLGVVEKRRLANNAYPAYLDLVRRQLTRDYREEDLRSEGLRIFTSLDPLKQREAEQAVAQRLGALERARDFPADTLQAAMLVTRAEDGEVLAVVGDRDRRQAGFNRALDARRPIGSLIKPVVYLTAFEQGYHMASLLDDSPLTWQDVGGEVWEPQNYDQEFRGPVLLHDALAYSLNVPTARLGLELGLARVGDTLERLGIERTWPEYPSALLGAWELTPIEIAQLYQNFASNGYRSPLRAIRAVVAADGTPLQRYPLAVERVIEPLPVYLLNANLQSVTREGTARAIAARFGVDRPVAGKTGTTDDLRDSWFAGYDADHLVVAWVGRDDNQPMGLTGSQGALRLWIDWFAAIGIEPLFLLQPPGVQWYDIDLETGLLADGGCDKQRELPFAENNRPTEQAPCAGKGPGSLFKRWFN